MSTRLRTRAAVVAGAALAAGAVAAAPASAATVKLAGGGTTLKLDRGTAKALDGLGVAVAPIKPAKAGKGGVTFPITGGRIDPATGAGRIAHSGGLQLRAGKTKVRLTDFVIRAGKGNTISVKAGKARLNAFSISLAKAKVTRSKPGGFGTTVRGVRVALTAKGAAALNGAFGVHAFAKGTPIGVATVRATPAELAFDGGATALALDPGAASALASLGVAVAPAVPASANADGSIAFPITEGKLNARTLAGSIEHAGGLTLSKGATSVTVRDFVIETAPVAKLTADLGGQRVDLLALDLSQIGTPSLAGGVATVSNVVAKLTDGAAAALNGAFGTTAFAGGLTIGTATVRAEGA